MGNIWMRWRAIACSVPALALCLVVAGPAHAADTAAPVIASLSAAPLSVDVSQSAKTVTFTARLTDDVGVGNGYVSLTNYTNGQSRYLDTSHFSRTAGTATDGTWKATVQIPVGTLPGEWKYYGSIRDTNGNSTYFNGGSGSGLPATRPSPIRVDIPPETWIESGPARSTRWASAVFALGSDAVDAKFSCSLDGAAWTSCTSRPTYTGLAVGRHTLRARATDSAGHLDTTPAAYTWTIDQTAPDTSFSSGPSGPTNRTSPSFGLSSTELRSTFRCRLIANAVIGAWEPCASPKSYAGLPDGRYTLEAKAIDAAGNADGTPARRDFRVDTVAPETTITSGPSGPTTDPSPSFAFSSSDAAPTFRCRLIVNGVIGAWETCTSPKAFSQLAPARYTLHVQAIDAAGNRDATPASRSFTVG